MTCICLGSLVANGCMPRGLEFKLGGNCAMLVGLFQCVLVFCQCCICWGMEGFVSRGYYSVRQG